MQTEDAAEDDVGAGDDGFKPAAEELFERNLEAFKQHLPALHKIISEHKPISKLIFSDDGEPNVDFQGTLLYPKGAATTADEQVSSFDSNAMRLFMGSITADSLDLHSREAFIKFTDRFDDSGFKYTHAPYRENAYFAIILGVGLGLHIQPILERTRCRMMVIVEPNMDFLYHSLSVTEWEPIFEHFTGRGVIEIHTASAPKMIADLIKPVFRAHNPMSLDGAILFEHYASTIFSETEKIIQKTLRTAVMGLGFYQDEVNMISQSYKNLETGTSRIIAQTGPNPDAPAFIVAAGPSLEHLIPFLQENQEKAVIFCCGSAIYQMMSHGLRPDFYVYPERVSDGAEILRDTSAEYDLTGIRFIGSSTVFPTLKDYFEESIFFFRPGLSSNPIFAQKEDQVLTVPDPLAANAGLSVAAHLKFREIYFLGVDCGSYSKEKTHAKGSWYETFDKVYHGKYTIPHPGNFGGTVWGDAVMQWSKENIENLVRYRRGCTFYNLGRGALFKGTAPRHPKSVSLPDLKNPKSDLIDRIVDACPVYTQAEFDTAWERAALIDRMHEFCETLKDAVRQDDDFEEFGYLKRLAEVLRPAELADALTMLFRGTLMTTVISFEYYLNRAIDREEREVMWQIFAEEFCDQVDRVGQRAIEVFTGLEDGEPWETDFIE